MSATGLAAKLAQFLQERGACLFAGAGVGKKAGLPLWDEYVEHLASVADRYEAETGVLIRKRLSSSHHLEAATYYKQCILIPDGVKYQELGAPFSTTGSYSPDYLVPLVALPFAAIVTTNYDRALHDACNLALQRGDQRRVKAPFHVELGDASMKQAIFWKDFFIARVHGRAEVPTTMVIDADDYRRLLDQAPAYQEFLIHILKTYRCLFVGYSFVDPAIAKVFQLMRETMPPPYLRLHLALIPSNSSGPLEAQLAQFNIEALTYSADTEHSELWAAIRYAQQALQATDALPPDKQHATPLLKRFLASCYSRLQLGKRAEPLREVVVEGIVAQAILDAGPEGATTQTLTQSLKGYFNLRDSDLCALVSKALDGLSLSGICKEREGRLVCAAQHGQSLDAVLGKLTEGVVSRLAVREGVNADGQMREAIGQIIDQLLLSRGWDLGAHFAGGNPSDTFDAWEQIGTHIKSLATSLSGARSQALARAVFELFRHPDDNEASFLADVGRIAFGVELILNSARSTMAQGFLLPEILYLDASVLMPAIAEGHPYSPLYADAISRLEQAARSTGGRIRVFTAKDFLNEIITHRQRAVEEVLNEGLEDVERLRRYVLLHGAENMNVYIGAYASWVGRSGSAILFGDFLWRVAPYDSEERLAEFLRQKGVEATDLSFRSPEDGALHNRLRIALHAAYEAAYEEAVESRPWYQPRKPGVLIDHEARQLARLLLDASSGRKSLFATADKRLMTLCYGPVMGACANRMVSRLGLIQLVDLVVGLETNKRSLGRMLWSVGFSDERTTIRNYLIDLALRHYDEAMTMAMWQVVDRITDQAVAAAKQEHLSVFPGKGTDRARTAAFLDRFEKDFFKNMSEAIERAKRRM
jgi:hypothetical protein